MSFCGPFEVAVSVQQGVLNNECFIDGLNIIPHTLFILITLPIIVVWNVSNSSRVEMKSWVHFPGHMIRWILSLILLFINMLEIAEGVLSDMEFRGIHLHVYVPHCVSLVGTLFSIIYYHNLEQWNTPKYLPLLPVYWIGSIITKSLKVSVLFNKRLGVSEPRYDLTWACIVLYALLLLVELNAFRKLKYAFFKVRPGLSPEVELAETSFIHGYVNFMSKATYWWINTLLLTGYKRVLTLQDLGKLPKSEGAKTNFKTLNDVFEAEKRKAAAADRKPSLWKCYFRAFWPVLALAALFKFLGDLLAFVGPACISGIIQYVAAQTRPLTLNLNHTSPSTSNTTAPPTYYISLVDFFSNGYILAVMLFVAVVLENTFLQNHHYLVIRQGIRLRAAIQSMVYTKSLKLSSWTMSSGNMTQGQIVNHLSTDAFNLMLLVYVINYVWAMPLQVIICMIFLYKQLGVSSLVGSSIIIILCPVQYKLASFLANIQKKTLETSDKRLKHTNELLNGIKLLKLYAWEKIFCAGVEDIRKKEIRLLLKSSLFYALTLFITEGTPIIVTLVTFALYPYLQNEPLTAEKAFSSLALFNILSVPLFIFPLTVKIIVNAGVSTKRLLEFFLAPEVEGVGLPAPLVPEQDPGIEIRVDFDQSGNHVISSSQEMKRMRTISACSNVSLGTISEDGHDDRKTWSHHGSHSDGLQSHSRQNSSEHIGKHSRPVSGLSSDGEEHCDIAREDTVAVEIEDGHFSWEPEGPVAYLQGVNLKFMEGKLSMIVGATGSGKSSLLSAILGEMYTLKGEVKWNQSCCLAYSAQKAWLLNATLQENILFGQPYNKRRYKRVLHACALQPDIDILPAGDQTEIGEKGINLSGGQKQRISVARAMYSKADVVLLDDPLSALDVHVRNTIFTDGILKFLLRKRRTVILVTHQLQYLNQAHKIVVMDEGKITHEGNLEEIKTKDPELYQNWKETTQRIRKESEREENYTAIERWKLLKTTIDISRQFHHQLSVKRRRLKQRDGDPDDDVFAPNDASATSDSLLSSEDVCQNALAGSSPVRGPKPPNRVFSRQMSQLSTCDDADIFHERPKLEHTFSITSAMSDIMEIQIEEKGGIAEEVETGKLMTEEERATGSVATTVYLAYIKACAVPLAIIVLAMHLFRQVLIVLTDFWLSNWASASQRSSENVQEVGGVYVGNTTDSIGYYNQVNISVTVAPPTGTDVQYYIDGYIGLSVASIFTALLVALTSQYTGLRAAYILHLAMLKSIILAPIRFFDTTPLGRILNRFSADTTTIDDRLPVTLESLIRSFLLCVSAVVVNAYTTPWFLLAAIPLIVIYYFLQRFFRSSSREIQRIDSVTKSPIFSHFSETLGGLATIRAYRDEARFRSHILQSIDTNNTAFLYLNTANRWLGIRLDFLGSTIVFVAALSSLSAGLSGSVSIGLVGLSIAYALSVSHYLNWVVRHLADTEMQMNAVERVHYYTHIPKEQYTLPEGNLSPDADWPKAGEVKFENVSLRYDISLSPVIDSITVHIKGGEKVGICGRTGSGKSSMTLGLFRIIDICQGQILIDGFDISRVPLDTLRSRLSIIPQDPVLFTGSVRYNLDPEGKHHDEDLWKALEIAQLKPLIEILPQELDSPVSEGGENYSVGQRQLFCIARAFLRKSSILIMDEATASVDMETDQIIQEVVNKYFGDRTILIIAHRISTILQCDKILVLDQGKIIEEESPKKLLANKNSVFSSLVKVENPQS